jgi:cytochrome b6-f complex iron-sulfur subunit
MRLKKTSDSGSCSDDQAGYVISRRGFLGSSALVVFPALCSGCTDSSPSLVDLPAVANNAIAIPLQDFPQLMNVGGSVVGKSAGYANPIVVARVQGDMYAALDAICTHQRCTVAYNALNRTLDCPCHGSTYEENGAVINGPAPRPLTTFPAHSDGTTLTITLA